MGEGKALGLTLWQPEPPRYAQELDRGDHEPDLSGGYVLVAGGRLFSPTCRWLSCWWCLRGPCGGLFHFLLRRQLSGLLRNEPNEGWKVSSM